jgi:hypothetical protein
MERGNNPIGTRCRRGARRHPHESAPLAFIYSLARAYLRGAVRHPIRPNPGTSSFENGRYHWGVEVGGSKGHSSCGACYAIT